jgi:hypothetical protein
MPESHNPNLWKTTFTEAEKCSRYDKNQCSQMAKFGVHAR